VTPIELEQNLTQAIFSNNENTACQAICTTPRAQLEFSCRAFAHCITHNMPRAAIMCAQNSYVLDITKEPACAHAIQASTDARGLLTFLQKYSYAGAKRTYYIDIAQAETSAPVLAALMQQGLLDAQDATEILSVALRCGNARVAQTLIDGGTTLNATSQNAEGVTCASSELEPNACFAKDSQSWGALATPRLNLATLKLVAAQIKAGTKDNTQSTGGATNDVQICEEWFSFYGRESDFANKLAVIVSVTPDKSHCSCVCKTFDTLIKAEQYDACMRILGWDITPDEASQMRACAVSAGAFELAAAALTKAQANAHITHKLCAL
jgi:hypothetical protein